MTALKLAFIGYGRHAKLNLYPSIKILGYQLSSVATTREETAKQASLDYQIPNFYTNYQRLLSEQHPDAVFVCTQPDRYYEIVKNVLLSGSHVFVEKPLGMTLSEAKSIADISKSTGKNVMVGFMKRFAPAYIKIKEIIDSQEFGSSLGVTQFYTSRNFAKDAREYILFAAIHYVDLLKWYFGDVAQVTGSQLLKENTVLLSFTIKFVNGAVGSLQYCGASTWEKASAEMTITGENGYVRIDGIDKVSVYHKNTKINDPRWQLVEENEQTFGTMLTTSGGGMQALYLNGFVGEIKHFVESIEQGLSPQNSAADNLKTMEFVDLLMKSLN